jgi:hypothetical protein
MGVNVSMSDVVKEINEAKTGGKKVDVMAIDMAEKAKIMAGEMDIVNPANARRLAGDDSKDVMIGTESTAGPQDEVVPPKSSDVVTGPLMGMSKGVPQQIDSSGPEDGIEDAGIDAKFDGSGKPKGVPSSTGVPQQTDKGKDGV